MGHGQGQQIGIGDLARTENALPANQTLLEQADLLGPEGMAGMAAGLGLTGRHLLGRLRIGIGGLRHDPHPTGLRQGAGGPALVEIPLQPGAGGGMHHVGTVEQGDDHIHGQQGPHSEAFEIAQLIDLFVAHQLLIAGRKGTESGHNRSARALGWGLAGESRAQQLRNHLTGGDALPARQLFGGGQHVVIDVPRGSHGQPKRKCIFASAHQVALGVALPRAQLEQVGLAGGADDPGPGT